MFDVLPPAQPVSDSTPGASALSGRVASRRVRAARESSGADWLARVRDVLSSPDALAAIDGGDDATRIDLLRGLEELKATAAAMQARLTVDFDESQRSGVTASRAGDPVGPEQMLADRRMTHSVGSQVGLARRESPHRGRSRVRFACRVVRLPHTWARFNEGVLSEHRAGLIVGAIADLRYEDQLLIDAELCADPAALDGVGDQRLEGWARRRGAELDPEAAVRRAARSYSERRVSVRPCPEGMAWLTALLPMCDAVGTAASLRRAATAARAAGDPRTVAQIMADTLVARTRDRALGWSANAPCRTVAGDADSAGPTSGEARSGPDGSVCDGPMSDATGPGSTAAGDADLDVSPTGQSSSGDTAPDESSGSETVPAAPVFRIDLIMTDTTLFGGGDSPEMIPGIGHLPAEVARNLVVSSLSEHELWLRRLYTHPRTGELVACDSRSRNFPPGLASLITLRDHTCRSPYCDAPIRHIDHVTPASAGGPTNLANGQGLCAACNYAKEIPGWRAHAEPQPPPRPGPDSGPGPGPGPDSGPGSRSARPPSPHVVHTTTPTGHRFTSRPPSIA